MTEDYNTGACGIYVRNGRENGLSTGIATWRALTFNGASEVSYAQAEVAYYEAILFDLVYDEKGGGMENTIYDDIMGASEAVKASNWKKICEGGQAALLNAPVSAENLDEIYSAVQQCESLKGILDKISSGTDILGYVDTGKEFLDKLSELSVLGSVSEETQEIITDMARAYTKADAMKAALDEYAILFTNLIDESTIINYLAGRTTLEQLSEECAKGLWSTVIGKMNSAGLAVEVGQTIGKMASNFLVSTDGIIETFYSMEAMTKFTEEFTKQVKTYGERFKAYPTVENAKRFNAAFEMLYKAQVINLDYAEKFLKQVNTEGFINYLFNGSEDEDYKSNLKSITNMKEDFSTYIDFKKASALSIYQELYPDNIETDFKDVVIEKPVSDEELAVIETEIETISEQIRDVTITEDTTFNANSEQYGDIILKDAVLDLNTHNMTIFGDLYIQGGTLKLNGGHLTVNGNVYHSDGLLYFSGGTLEASGNYCMGSENTDGTIVTSDGEIKMDNASDLLKVNGNIYLYCYSGADIQWTAGITEIGGNLYRYSSGAPGISGSHKTVFTGSQDLTISSEGWNGNLRLANVEILNTAVRKIIWKGNMEISESLTIDSERLEVNAEELNIQITGWEGKPVKINGDVNYAGGFLDMSGCELEVTGNLNVTGGEINLNGGKLVCGKELLLGDNPNGLLNLNGGEGKIAGNVSHMDGTLYINGGTLDVAGNYYMGSENTDGTIVTSDGEIKMDNASDLLKVNGNIYLYCYSGADIQWTAGITEIGGNLYRYSSGAPGISGSHKTVFTGSQDLTISSEGWNGNLRLANVEILNTAVRKIIWKGNMEISESLTIDSERLEVNAEELNIQITGWEGKPVKINGDVNYAGGFLDMSGCELEVTGNLNVTGGEINLNGGKLVCGKELLLGDNPNGLLNLNGGEGKIAGNVSHMDGTLYMNGGTLDVAGNYYMGSENTDGTIESSNGEIKMDNASDRLKVNGNIYLYCYSGAGIRWTAGITEIGGNLYRYSNGTTGISGSHKTVFTGSQDLTIESKGWNGSLKLANVEIQNALSRTVTFIGEIDISDSLKCDSEELRIAAQDAVLSGAGFSNLNLIVDGNLTYDSGTWSLNGKSLQVNGDIHQNGGILNLGKGNLTVIGSYYHQEGTLNPAGGAVKIGGNYYNAVLDTDSSSGDTIFGIASGILYMNHTASSMDVAGDFVMASDEWHSNKLTAGTIAIQGNFTQISGNEYNFACGESLKVILNGKDVQHVSFESNQSKFNILQITKDKNTGYVFSPDPCWNELEEIQNEFAVLVQPEDCAVGEGETAGFMTKASGEDLTYQWQYCDPESDQWKDVQSEGSRTDTLSVKVTSDMDGQRYRCIIKNGEGKSLVTEEAVLNIKYELTILQQPSDFSGREGDTALFTVTAAGYQVTYQWQYQNAGSQEWKNSSMAGSRSSTLVVPVTGSRNGQKYRCVLTDGDGKRLVTEETVLRTKTENPFTDVIQGQYYYEPILWAYENGIASGLSEDKFGPDETCTRAQVVIFLWRAKGQPEALIQELPFEDVSKGAYYYEAVAWAYENQIVSGIDATHFKPDDTVSRGQFVTFLYRAEGKPGYTTENPFTDVTKDSYYYDSVLWAYEKGVASGLSSDRFGIDEQCTRGQVATFLYRAYN